MLNELTFKTKLGDLGDLGGGGGGLCDLENVLVLAAVTQRLNDLSKIVPQNPIVRLLIQVLNL